MEAKTIIIDVDGCLTDNKVYYTHDNHRIKGFHSRDIRAIRELIANGYNVILLTQSGWEGMNNYARRTGAEVVVARDKWEWVSNFQKEQFIALGDDVPDIDVLSAAKKAFCPLDADNAVKKLGNIQMLPCNGGEGVVAELVTLLFKKRVEPPQFPKDRTTTHY